MQLQTEEELLTGIRRWVEIESQTADVAGVNRMMDDTEEVFRAEGARVERIPGRDGYGDCLSISSAWGGDEPGILVLCHLDTVHPKGTLDVLPFRIEDDKAYGPGTTDMKGGAYLAFAAYQSLVREGRQTPLPIRFLYVSDEEVGSPSSRGLIEAAGDKAKYVLVTEATRQGGNLVVARNGTARYQITANGVPAHSGGQHKWGRSAVREIARHILMLEEQTDYDRQLTFNVGQVRGGTSDNTIPGECVARVDVRVARMEDYEYADKLIRGLTPHDPDVQLSVTGRLNRPPYAKTPGIQSLLEHAQKISKELGFEVDGVATAGGSDGSLVANKVPTLDGLGVSGGGAHTLKEYLKISSLIPRLSLMRRMMETLE